MSTLEYISRALANLGRRRIIMDHVDASQEYMHRHYLYGKPDGDKHGPIEICLHKILCSDDDFLHNHPSPYLAILLSGSYREHTPSGSYIRRPGHIRVRGRHALHRLELVSGPVWTIFVMLKRIPGPSQWEFLVNGKLVDHETHLGIK